ncbi:MAG: hypothetical protein V3T17_19165 [Pseudomonadales bacterium]
MSKQMGLLTVLVSVVAIFPFGLFAKDVVSVDRIDAIIQERELVQQMITEIASLQRLADRAEALNAQALPLLNYAQLSKHLANIGKNLDGWLARKPGIHRQLSIEKEK